MQPEKMDNECKSQQGKEPTIPRTNTDLHAKSPTLKRAIRSNGHSTRRRVRHLQKTYTTRNRPRSRLLQSAQRKNVWKVRPRPTVQKLQ